MTRSGASSSEYENGCERAYFCHDGQLCRRAELCRGWDHCHAAVPDTGLGDNPIGEVLPISARILESGRLYAAVVVEMDMYA
jgi:hypothetical protein